MTPKQSVLLLAIVPSHFFGATNADELPFLPFGFGFGVALPFVVGFVLVAAGFALGFAACFLVPAIVGKT